jgi:2-methylisocitrate lyase-like PEP mutase family enzyme
MVRVVAEARADGRAYDRPMPTQTELAARFLALHHGPSPLLMPNPWDAGSARVLASLGFTALATTSSGFAATLGRLDGSVSREEALAHAASVVAAVDVPVSGDLEHGFAADPDGVAGTVTGALAAGLAGCSIEDSTGDADEPIFPFDLAVARVEAAATVAHAGPVHLVLTARAENHLYGRTDLAETITRLQAFQEAGADVLFAPGITELADIRRVVAAVDRPVNVLALAGVAPVAELAAVGVSRISVGGAFAWIAYGAAARAGAELLRSGTYGYLAEVPEGRQVARSAFGG